MHREPPTKRDRALKAKIVPSKSFNRSLLQTLDCCEMSNKLLVQQRKIANGKEAVKTSFDSQAISAKSYHHIFFLYLTVINSNLCKFLHVSNWPESAKSPPMRANQGRLLPKKWEFSPKKFPAHRHSFRLVRWPPTTHKLSLFITLALIHPIFCHILSPSMPPKIAGGTIQSIAQT